VKPLLGVAGAVDDLGELVEVCNEAIRANYGEETDVTVTALASEPELRAFEAGELVLYKRPPRRRGNKIMYVRDGEKVELEQITLSL
jgi:hypothetical protein